ncbi:MAG: helix-turn-helix domain-containing protein [Anaerolineae bacterium]
MAQESPPEVGIRLRHLREQRGLSLRALAERSDLSVNAVSLIERGQSSPTVSTLHRLAAALEVRIVDFFGSTDADQAVFVPAGRRMRTQTEGAVIESLGSGLAGQRIQPLMVTLQAGAGSGREPITHEGQELVVGLVGEVEYAVGDRPYRLGEGDALLFDATVPHHWRNAGVGESRFLLVLEAIGGGGTHFRLHLEE